MTPLVVVTATTRPSVTAEYWRTWRERAWTAYPMVVVWGGATEHASTAELGNMVRDRVLRLNGYGVVRAFLEGIKAAVDMGAEVVACLHDDLAISTMGWDAHVVRHFQVHPRCLLAGFGGAKGLGADDIYQVPYKPMQLARQRFMSNMRDAEAHGERTGKVQRVACLDGFSLIGRVSFMLESFERMYQFGMRHHFYDSLLGAYAAKAGGEAWLLPFACHHAGGLTAVGDAQYQTWARQVNENGDQGFWEHSHRIGYEECRGVLPLRVE